MDEFDIVDVVYAYVLAANTGLPIYKDRSDVGVTHDHIVINHLEFHEQDWLNVLPVNVNIFVKDNDNGMPKRQAIRQHKRAVRAELLKIKTENGHYRNSSIAGSLRMPGLKEGFDCVNIKVIVKVDK